MIFPAIGHTLLWKAPKIGQAIGIRYDKVKSFFQFRDETPQERTDRINVYIAKYVTALKIPRAQKIAMIWKINYFCEFNIMDKNKLLELKKKIDKMKIPNKNVIINGRIMKVLEKQTASIQEQIAICDRDFAAICERERIEADIEIARGRRNAHSRKTITTQRDIYESMDWSKPSKTLKTWLEKN